MYYTVATSFYVHTGELAPLRYILSDLVRTLRTGMRFILLTRKKVKDWVTSKLYSGLRNGMQKSYEL